MTNEEKLFLDAMDDLSPRDLESWINNQLIGSPQLPQPPFAFVNDPFDVPEGTLKFLNRVFTQQDDEEGGAERHEYRQLLDRFENALVTLFAREVNHSYPHPGLLFNYIYLFTNTQPRWNARQRLIEVLLLAVAMGKWEEYNPAGRNLHYDALELLITLSSLAGHTFLGIKSIDDYLISNLRAAKSSRFCSIALRYFRETYKVPSFFNVLEQSFKILPKEKMGVLADQIIIFYRKYPLLSFGYLADWLSSKQANQYQATREKLNELYNHANLFSLVMERWFKHKGEYMEDNRQEGRHLIALMVLIMVQSMPEKIEPALIREFFRNEHFEHEFNELNEKSKTFDPSYNNLNNLLSERHSPAPNYSRVHIGTLLALSESVTGSVTNFDLNNADIIPLQIYLEENSKYAYFNIITAGEDLLEIIGEKPASPKEIRKSDVLATFLWWEHIDSVRVAP